MTRPNYEYDFSNDELKAWHQYAIAAIHHPDAHGQSEEFGLYKNSNTEGDGLWEKIQPVDNSCVARSEALYFPFRQAF